MKQAGRILRQPLVSVIIPSFNHEDFVKTAIRSVLDQGINDIEVIVVDDGSSDGTVQRVSAIRDSRVQIVPQRENRRVHPRNLALSMARGRYVAFQNSDDEWKPGKLAAQLEVLENDPRVVVCFTGVEAIGPDGKTLTDSWANGLFSTANRSSPAWLRHFFEAGNCLCLPSAVARREVVERAGRFRPSLIQLSDFDLWVRLAALGEFRVIEHAFTRMRVIPGRNVSGPSPDARRRSNVEFSYVLERFLDAPVFECLPDVFADLLPKTVRSRVAYQAWLVAHAWVLGTPGHRLFADRALAVLLDDPSKREELCEVFGVELIHAFNNKRGELEVGVAT